MSEQEQTIEQRSNDNITVLFKMRPGCIVKMEVHVNPIATKAAHEKALKELKKDVVLPGFRKGKVPTDVILKNFGKEIDRYYKEIVTNLTFKEATQLIQRKPFTTRSLRKCEFKHEGRDGSCVLLFEYEAAPEIQEVDPLAFSFQKVITTEPSEEDIAASLAKLKVLHANKEATPEKPIQEGDLVTTSVFIIPDTSEKAPTPLFQNEEIHLQKGLVPDWLYTALLGMQSGEKKEAEIVTPSDAPKKCTIEVSSVQTCILPEETDEFAIKAGATSLDDLKNKLIQKKKDQLLEEARSIQHQEFKNELIAKYAFDLPQSLIESETEARYQGYIQAHPEATNKENLRKEFQEEVKRYFTCLFLMEQVAKKINPTFSQAEFFNEISHQLFHTSDHERTLYPGLSQENIEQRILMSIMIKKCCDWCIEKSQNALVAESGEENKLER